MNSQNVHVVQINDWDRASVTVLVWTKKKSNES